jgi:predicted deacylase
MIGVALGAASLGAQGTVSSWIPVPGTTDSIPITTITGARPGPTLALVAGVQGLKVAPIVALQQLRESIDPRTLRGTVILVHIANPPSFRERLVRRGPDGKNLNRVFPGRIGGSISERLAAVLTSEVVAKADYVIDLHAGDGNESLTPFAFAARPGLDTRVDSAARALANAWGPPYLVWDKDGPTTLAEAAYLQTMAHLMGKPALTAMVGERGVATSADVLMINAAVQRVLVHLRMLDAAVAAPRAPVVLEAMDMVLAPHSGLWFPEVSAGQRVGVGEPLGVIKDSFGNELGRVVAPAAGVVLYLAVWPPIAAGEGVVLLGITGAAR